MQRKERDFLGELEIDNDLYYGIQTTRGMALSGVTGHTIGKESPELIYYLAAIKKAAAKSNWELQLLEEDKAKAIMTACDEVMDGEFDTQFPTDMLTGGGGISVHMNINEVLAHRASEILTGRREDKVIHPNTHVNMGQSTNDVYPSAIDLAVHDMLIHLADETEKMLETVRVKENEFRDVVKLGRTCLQDALPITFGQEFSAYAVFLERQVHLLRDIAGECLILPMGATAVGTGAGSSVEFIDKLYLHLSEMTGLPIQKSQNLFDSLQNGDLYQRISTLLKTLSSGLSKMATDFRLLSSGPRAGMEEMRLPAVTPGSSIMPGKINPVIPELMNQIYFIVCGHDVSVTLAVESSELDLNVWESAIFMSLQESCHMLIKGIPIFAEKCVAQIVVNEKLCEQNARQSTATASVVSSVFGYDVGCEVAREAKEKNETIVDVVIHKNLLPEEEARALLDPKAMTDITVLQERIQKAREHIKE